VVKAEIANQGGEAQNGFSTDSHLVKGECGGNNHVQ